MLVEFLYELKENIDRHGIRWGLIFAFYALFRKERRNYRLDRRDDAIFHNQKVIMDHLGLSDQFIGQVSESQAGLQSFKRLSLSLRKGIQWASQLKRRVKMMNQNINWGTFIPALIGVIKLSLQPFGIDLTDITDAQVNSIINGFCALFAVVGVIINHFKKSTPTIVSQQSKDYGPTSYQ